MRRHRLALAALPCALLLSMPLSAQQVYKWKDANGVTQYSSTPPPEGRRFETREVDHRAAAPAPRAQEAASGQEPPEASAEDPACATARTNLALLGTSASLRVDSDGDGKPDKTLDDQDRANQRALMEATIKVRCAAAPAQPDEAEER